MAAVGAVSLWMVSPSRTDDRQVPPQDAVPTVFDPSIAVLPLRTLSTDPTVLTLVDGLVDELVNELSGPRLEPLRRLYPLLQANSLKVAPVTTTRRYRNTNEAPASIGRSLGVAYLVDGSVRAGDEQLRITLQLIRAADNEQVWSHTYDRALGDLLAGQAEIARHAAWSVTATIPNDFWHRSNRAEFTDGTAHHSSGRIAAPWNTCVAMTSTWLQSPRTTRSPSHWIQQSCTPISFSSSRICI